MSSLNKKREILKRNYCKTLSKFSLIEMKEHVIKLFEDVTWDIVKKIIIKYNIPSKTQNIAKIILELTKEFSYEDLQITYYNLLLLDVTLHSSRKYWTAAIMKQENNKRPDTDFTNNIIQEFKKQYLNVLVYSQLRGGIRWFVLVIIKKSKNQRIIHQKPFFIARSVNEPYIFFSPKNVNQDKLKVVALAFGFSDLKIRKLSGKDVPSLILMLRRHKEADKLRAENALFLQNENDTIDCVRTSRGLDFCQDKVRLTHAEKMFGDENIKLESLVIKAQTEWRGLRTLPEYEGNELNMSIRIRSKDVRQTLQEFMQNGVIEPPYPEWLKEFFISGKNVINIG